MDPQRPPEDGPPPPPPGAGGGPAARGPGATAGAGTRTRNRRWPLVLALVVVLVGVPAGLFLVSLLEDDDTTEDTVASPDDQPDGQDQPDDGGGEPDDGGDDGPDDGGDDGPDDGGDDGPDDGSDDGPDDGPDAGGDEVLPVDPLDLDPLEGTDLVWGRLLTDIDAAEREMIAFQDQLAEAFSDPDGDLDDPLDAAVEVAATRRAALLEIRSRLAEGIDDADADEVRARYVAHLDAWASFMAAVEEDPLVVTEQSERGFTVDINATADAFTRGLEERLPDDIDPEVERFAEAILERGFRGSGTAQV